MKLIKPSRNKVYCIGCERSKMLFKSEAKANNFIKFNAEKIALESGKKPLRSYYCNFCCGWHITSLADTEIAARLDKRDARKWRYIKSYNINLSKKVGDDNKSNKTTHDPVIKTTSEPSIEASKELGIKALSKTITKTVNDITSDLLNLKFQQLIIDFDYLLDLEKQLKLIEAKLCNTTKLIQKNYQKISKIKNLYLSVSEYIIESNTREEYLHTLSTNGQHSDIYIIIQNFEVVIEINKYFRQMRKLTDSSDFNSFMSLYNRVIYNVTERLKGNPTILKEELITEAKEILMSAKGFEKYKDEIYRIRILKIISLLQDAFCLIDSFDYDGCKDCVLYAECLLGQPSNDTERLLYSYITKARSMVA